MECHSLVYKKVAGESATTDTETKDLWLEVVYLRL